MGPHDALRGGRPRWDEKSSDAGELIRHDCCIVSIINTHVVVPTAILHISTQNMVHACMQLHTQMHR